MSFYSLLLLSHTAVAALTHLSILPLQYYWEGSAVACLGSKCLEERLEIGRFLVDVMVIVICGVMIWPVGRAQGRNKDAIVRALSCLEGN